MPRKPSATPRKRRAPTRSAVSETPRLLSDEEKRELIRAHAAARAPQDPVQRMSLWAGVTLSVLMLAVGWWLTVGWNVRQSVAEGSNELRALTQQLNDFADRVEEDPSLGLDQLNPTPTANASSFDAQLKAHLETSASGTHPLTDPGASDEIDGSTSTSPFATDPTPTIPAGLTPDP